MCVCVMVQVTCLDKSVCVCVCVCVSARQGFSWPPDAHDNWACARCRNWGVAVVGLVLVLARPELCLVKPGCRGLRLGHVTAGSNHHGTRVLFCHTCTCVVAVIFFFFLLCFSSLCLCWVISASCLTCVVPAVVVRPLTRCFFLDVIVTDDVFVRPTQSPDGRVVPVRRCSRFVHGAILLPSLRFVMRPARHVCIFLA